MKKLFLLTITLFTLFSCGPNDENLDPIVGTWSPFSESGMELNDCAKRTRLTFSENGNFSTISYFENSNNECISDGTLNGTWANDGSNTYSITINNDTNTTLFSFSNNNNSFTSNRTVFNRIN